MRSRNSFSPASSFHDRIDEKTRAIEEANGQIDVLKTEIEKYAATAERCD